MTPDQCIKNNLLTWAEDCFVTTALKMHYSLQNRELLYIGKVKALRFEVRLTRDLCISMPAKSNTLS